MVCCSHPRGDTTPKRLADPVGAAAACVLALRALGALAVPSSPGASRRPGAGGQVTSAPRSASARDVDWMCLGSPVSGRRRAQAFPLPGTGRPRTLGSAGTPVTSRLDDSQVIIVVH